MEDVIEVMKLLCYEMMEIQRQQQDSSVGHSVEIVWTLLSQQIDPLVVLLSIQTGQVGAAAQHPRWQLDKGRTELHANGWGEQCHAADSLLMPLLRVVNGVCLLLAGVHNSICGHGSWPWPPAASSHPRLQVSHVRRDQAQTVTRTDRTRRLRTVCCNG